MKLKDELDMLASLGVSPDVTPIGTNDALVETSPTAQTSLDNYVPDTSTTGHSGLTTATEEKALQLLGNRVDQASVAAALGVSPSRISQLLSNKVFADKVAHLRYENLQKHNRRDEAYDSLEDKLLQKLDRAMPMLIKPESILKAMQIVNGAKRRGQTAPDTTSSQATIANLTIPTVIVNKFSVDINNQVTKAGQQELITMPSGNLLKRVEDAAAAASEAHQIGESHADSK